MPLVIYVTIAKYLTKQKRKFIIRGMKYFHILCQKLRLNVHLGTIQRYQEQQFINVVTAETHKMFS